MNKSTTPRRAYDGAGRAKAAGQTRALVLEAARHLMGQHGIDAVTIAAIADEAKVAASTIYAGFKSKEGILRALMEDSLFGPRYQRAQALLSGVTDPVRQIELTAQVARAIYEGERHDLGMIRHASGFSPALRAVEKDFEDRRLAMQAPRIAALFAAGRANPALTQDEARRVMWLLTGRTVYQSLVHDGGWTPDRYQSWLTATLMAQLVA